MMEECTFFIQNDALTNVIYNACGILFIVNDAVGTFVDDVSEIYNSCGFSFILNDAIKTFVDDVRKTLFLLKGIVDSLIDIFVKWVFDLIRRLLTPPKVFPNPAEY